MWEEYRYVDVKHETSPRWERILRADLKGWVEANAGRENLFSTIQTFASPAARDNEPHWCPFFIDLDSDTFDLSLKEARFIVDYFLTGFEVEPAIWFSGNRGFHITVDAVAFGAEPSPELTYIWRHLAERIAAQLGLTTLDKRVYSRRRMWRIDGTRHAKSGLYKRRIELGDFRTATAEDIRDRAKEPLVVEGLVHGETVELSSGLQTLYSSSGQEYQDRQRVLESEPVAYFFPGARRLVSSSCWRTA